MLQRKGFEASVVFPVELNEDVVPDFQHIGVILIDLGGRVSASDPVEVNFTVDPSEEAKITGHTARAYMAHKGQ